MEYASLREKIAAEKNERLERYQRFSDIVNDAIAAGEQAGVECRPIPMDVIDDARGLSWRIDDGTCGFAWITVKPANSSFAIWGKKNKILRPAYGGGVQYWVSQFGQSVERKAAFAAAFAEVLRKNGIKAYAGDRLD